eukprot:2681403-Pyramimonas_sp.AAC.2
MPALITFSGERGAEGRQMGGGGEDNNGGKEAGRGEREGFAMGGGGEENHTERLPSKPLQDRTSRGSTY